jgi:hypothetical protein
MSLLWMAIKNLPKHDRDIRVAPLSASLNIKPCTRNQTPQELFKADNDHRRQNLHIHLKLKQKDSSFP